jgi:allantoinase
MWREGVLGFKCFTVPSGIDEFPDVGPEDLRRALPRLAALGAVLLVHAEDRGVVSLALRASGLNDYPRRYRSYLMSRPKLSEVEAVRMIAGEAGAAGARIHIVHMSSGEGVASVQTARWHGLKATTETCPHYLRFAAEDIEEGATIFKCAPPIRERAVKEELWDCLRKGSINLIASDHSPCPPEMKQLESGDFAKAWGGISGLQVMLPVVWTGAAARGFGLEHIVKWLCTGPATLAGIDGFKGRLAPGYDGDLIVFDPDAVWRVEARRLQHRHKITPYDGAELRGVVKGTMVRGRWVYADGDWAGKRGGEVDGEGFLTEPVGQWVKRERS